MGSRMGKGERTTLSRKIKQDKVYSYLVGLANSNKELPNLTTLYRTKFKDDMHLTNLMEVLQQLNIQGKIIYRKGKILAVSVPKVNAPKERAFKFDNKEKKYGLNNVKPVSLQIDAIEDETKDETFEERYAIAVKQLIADYILNSNVTTRDEIVEYIDSLFKITDKLKDKMFNRIIEKF